MSDDFYIGDPGDEDDGTMFLWYSWPPTGETHWLKCSRKFYMDIKQGPKKIRRTRDFN